MMFKGSYILQFGKKGFYNHIFCEAQVLKSTILSYASDTCARRGPLDGIRVCDMSRILAGPYCTMVLGDLGAEVIKIERPEVGDETRTWGPPFIAGESLYYMSINRNKKSICIDVKSDEGKEIIYELVKKSDVFVENYVPGKLDSMGFGYQMLKQMNPSLVYCSLSGYGSRGPDKMKSGYDLVASAIGGLMHVTGHKDGGPNRCGVAVTDIMTGLYANIGILAALFQRSMSKHGKKIDVSLLQSQVAALADVASSFLNAGVEGTRHGTSHPTIVPYQSFKTLDGEVVIAAATDKHFQNLCKAIDCNELSNDARFKTNPQRVKNRDVLLHILEERFKCKPCNYWIALLETSGVPCGLINNVQQVFSMPQVDALDIVQEIQHPTAGTVRLPAPALDINGSSTVTPPLHPPLLGEHTYDVMRNVLNYDENTIDRLLDQKVISVHVD